MRRIYYWSCSRHWNHDIIFGGVSRRKIAHSQTPSTFTISEWKNFGRENYSIITTIAKLPKCWNPSLSKVFRQQNSSRLYVFKKIGSNFENPARRCFRCSLGMIKRKLIDLYSSEWTGRSQRAIPGAANALRFQALRNQLELNAITQSGWRGIEPASCC